METYPYSKYLRLKKYSPLLWNVLENMFEPKKKSSPDGALLELKKEGEPWRTTDAPLRHIHSRICPPHWLIKWLRKQLSYLQSKYLCTFISNMFDGKILSYIFFKVSLKSKHKIELLKHNIHSSQITLALKTYKLNLAHKNGTKFFFQGQDSFQNELDTFYTIFCRIV